MHQVFEDSLQSVRCPSCRSALLPELPHEVSDDNVCVIDILQNGSRKLLYYHPLNPRCKYLPSEAKFSRREQCRICAPETTIFPGCKSRAAATTLKRLIEVESATSTSSAAAPIMRLIFLPTLCCACHQPCLFQLLMRSLPHSSCTTCGTNLRCCHGKLCSLHMLPSGVEGDRHY